MDFISISCKYQICEVEYEASNTGLYTLYNEKLYLSNTELKTKLMTNSEIGLLNLVY